MKLSIGQVSKLFDISMDTLRHYDKIGLLKPEVNPENGYRYYSTVHFDKIILILEGKSLGIPLAQIKETFDKGDLKNFEGLLTTQEEIIEQKISELKKAKKRIKETKNLLEKIKTFQNNYDFDSITQSIPFEFYKLNIKTFFGGDKYREYISIFEDDLGGDNCYGLFSFKNGEPYYDESIIYFPITPTLKKYFKVHKLKENIITFENPCISVDFCGSYEELAEYIAQLQNHFSSVKEVYVNFNFFVPYKDREIYYCKIILSIEKP